MPILRIPKIGSRSSPLARAQVEEVRLECGVDFEVVFVKTTGDLDQATSLRSLDKTDFFTRELDQMLLAGKIDAAIHSAKDLPDPLPKKASNFSRFLERRQIPLYTKNQLNVTALINTSLSSYQIPFHIQFHKMLTPALFE